MGSKIIGVEFGSDTLKIAVVSGGKVTAMAAEHLPVGMMAEGRVTAPAAMSQFIKEMCARNGLPRSGSCALIMPQQNYIARKISMPVMGVQELNINLPYEFRDFVGKDGPKFSYDYLVESIKDNVMNLYATAIRNEITEEFAEILRKAGFKLKASMPEDAAWLNLIRTAKNEPKRIAIIDVGAARTHVSIFANGIYEMGRDISIAGNDIDKAIAAAEKSELVVARAHKEGGVGDVTNNTGCNEVCSTLAVEVMRVLNFYRTRAEENEGLSDIYFCGGSSALEMLRTAIVKRTDMVPHHIRRFLTIDGPDYFSSYCAIAAAAAMQLQ